MNFILIGAAFVLSAMLIFLAVRVMDDATVSAERVKAAYFIQEVASSIDRLSAHEEGQRELVAESPMTIEIYNIGGIRCGLGVKKDCGLAIRASIHNKKTGIFNSPQREVGPFQILGNVDFGEEEAIRLVNVKTVCISKKEGAVEVREICAA